MKRLVKGDLLLTKSKINLNDGYLELTPVWDGRVLLGEVSGTKLSSKEIISCLYKEGIHKGFIHSCIGMLEQGFQGQIPIAMTQIEIDPGIFYYLNEPELGHTNLIKFLDTSKLPDLNMMFPVKPGQNLLKLQGPPANVLSYPDGEKQIIDEYSVEETSYYVGLNTYFNAQDGMLQSQIEGCTHRDSFGSVMVYPLERLYSLGKAHGNLTLDKAVEVEADIRSESELIIPSNLLVQGIIRSSTIAAGGNVDCLNGLDNSTNKERGSLTVGQSLLTSDIRNYKVWAGKYCIARNSIEGSIIRCMGTIATQRIIGSEIRIAHKLYVNDIKKNSHIFLGPKFVKDTELNKRKNFHSQHLKRLMDLDNQMQMQKQKLEHEKGNTIKHLKKIRQMGGILIASDFVFQRLVKNQYSGFKEFMARLDDYDRGLKRILDERMFFAFYENERQASTSPEIIVNGTLFAGTIITAPNQVMKIQESRSKVRIKLELGSGTINISDLDEKVRINKSLPISQISQVPA